MLNRREFIASSTATLLTTSLLKADTPKPTGITLDRIEEILVGAFKNKANMLNVPLSEFKLDGIYKDDIAYRNRRFGWYVIATCRGQYYGCAVDARIKELRQTTSDEDIHEFTGRLTKTFTELFAGFVTHYENFLCSDGSRTHIERTYKKGDNYTNLEEAYQEIMDRDCMGHMCLFQPKENFLIPYSYKSKNSLDKLT